MLEDHSYSGNTVIQVDSEEGRLTLLMCLSLKTKWQYLKSRDDRRRYRALIKHERIDQRTYYKSAP